MSESELVDVIDLSRRKTGEVLPRGQLFAQKKHFLSVHVWLVNSRKQFLLQKRNSDKKVDPGLWSVCGGVVKSGETSLQTAIRETGEEIGLNLCPEDMRLVMQCPECDKWGSLVDVWLAKVDVSLQDLSLRKNEVSDAGWFDVEQLKWMFASGEASPNISFAFPAIGKML